MSKWDEKRKAYAAEMIKQSEEFPIMGLYEGEMDKLHGTCSRCHGFRYVLQENGEKLRDCPDCDGTGEGKKHEPS